MEVCASEIKWQTIPNESARTTSHSVSIGRLAGAIDKRMTSERAQARSWVPSSGQRRRCPKTVCHGGKARQAQPSLSAYRAAAEKHQVGLQRSAEESLALERVFALLLLR